MIDQGNDTVWIRAARHELEVEIIPDGMTRDDANARARAMRSCSKSFFFTPFDILEMLIGISWKQGAVL